MVLQSCMSRSTAHGLANIASEENMSAKIMWGLLTVMVASIFTYHTSLLYWQLKEDQVSTSVEPNSIPFIQPDIVFCPERFLARDFINNPPEDEYEYMKNVSMAIQRVDARFRKLPRKSPIFIWDLLNLHHIFKAFFHRPEELFVKIICNYNDITADGIKVDMNIVHLACFRLTPKVCNLTTPMSSLIITFYNHIFGVNVNYTKLNVNVDGRPLDSYVFAPKEYYDEIEDGLFIYFVQPNEMIHKSTARVTARPNTHADIRITSTKYKRIVTKRYLCEELDRIVQIYDLLEKDMASSYINYSYSNICPYLYQQDNYLQKHRCVSKQLPIRTGFMQITRFCGRMDNVVIQRTYEKYILASEITNDYQLVACRFKTPCSSIRHSTVVSNSNWPSTSSLIRFVTEDLASKLKAFKERNISSPGFQEMFDDFQRKPANIDQWKRNFIKVSIAPGEFLSSNVMESRSYTFKNFFSDAGGIMGFYMGASVLTMCEVFRLMYYIVRCVLPRSNEGLEMDSRSLADHHS